MITSYPIQFLQDKLHGIMTGDMIMIAASTGVGKSTLSRAIMQHASNNDVPAVLFSLEDEPGTYAADSIYRAYLRKVFDPLDYRQWLLDFSANPKKYAEEQIMCAERALARTKDDVPLTKVHEMRTPNWCLKEVIETMKEEIEAGYKLFILDHMDVLVPSERPADMVNAINELWRLVAENQVALITFSQLATNRNKEALCPGIDDLRGSKSKVHTPTIVLSVARHNYGYYDNHKGKATYLRILKNRQGGNTCAAVVFFDKGTYLPDYKEVQCNESGTTIDGETQKSLLKRQI